MYIYLWYIICKYNLYIVLIWILNKRRRKNMNVSGYATDVVKMWIDNKQITKKVYSYIYFSFITLPVRRCQLFVYFVSTICLQSHHHLRSNWKLKIFMKIIGVLCRASSLYYIYDICKYKYYIPQQKNTVGKA